MKKVTITIDTDYIPAMALLKLAGVTGTGGQAGYGIEAGLVSLDGTVIHEKRKKVYPGQVLSVGREWQILVNKVNDRNDVTD
ncbi:MAG: RNA-binding S4 domain-containing protein [Acidaminococcaceae bacterium]|jgi:ribosome-associated protein|nr:RNA-binding S4 domain-containing protein [Acidaminococcaceae bacterium]HAY61026.1 RNA-binding protein [Acidaminococcaceae bacterium]